MRKIEMIAKYADLAFGMDMPPIAREIHALIIKAENEVLSDVANHVLGREAKEEDMKDFQIVRRQGVYNEFTFCYKNTPLGIVKSNWSGNSFIVLFTPASPTFIAND